MRVTKKWLREAKFLMRSEIARVTGLTYPQLCDEYSSVYHQKPNGMCSNEMICSLLYNSLEQAIPYQMVN